MRRIVYSTQLVPDRDEICLHCRAEQFDAAVSQGEPIPPEVVVAIGVVKDIMPEATRNRLGMPIGATYAQASQLFCCDCGKRIDEIA